ncbi:MAG TPA: aminoglycoside phosphotransferase family protein [Jatrophihabitans sp.]|nr:aminoglycoside phosphotransferase family protein [Jatrophihabitans sp.]
MAGLVMPRNLVEAAKREGRAGWLASLPANVAELKQLWSLEIGAPFQPGGQTAWVAPARDRTGTELVLKIVWPHPEAAHEAAGLATWRGRGTVALHAAEHLDGASALLLERCVPGTALSFRPEAEQDSVTAGLLLRLWIEPAGGHGFRPLSEMCAQWADGFEAKLAAGNRRIDPGLAREGIALWRLLPTTAERNVLLCTDLHAGNVLAAEREPWLVIDPKPYIGDPTYDVLQHMLNCDQRLHADPLGFIRQMAQLVQLDAGRLRVWLFARCVLESAEFPELADVADKIAPP